MVTGMCGIVGYVGHQRAADVVVAGLRRLEYRGYDSAGVAVAEHGHIDVRRKAGKIGNLDIALAADPMPVAGAAMGHTRWATHGGPTDANAHPHKDCSSRFAVVHNGIIENHAILHAELIADGHVLSSQTDTEVVAHLLEAAAAMSPTSDLPELVRHVVAQLDGAFTLVLIDAVTLPRPRRGDLLAVPATGAYTLAMSSTYNGVPRPAAVLVRDGETQLIRARETVDDLLRYERS